MQSLLSVCEYVPDIEIHTGNSVAKCHKNEDSLKITCQEHIKKLISRKWWKCIGHILRRPDICIARQVLD